jgi:hypothetical protein
MMIVAGIYRFYRLNSAHNLYKNPSHHLLKINLNTMKNLTPTTISALLLLTSGAVLAYLGCYLPPQGEISDSVLWYTSQCIIYAGSVFGVAGYVKTMVNKK